MQQQTQIQFQCTTSIQVSARPTCYVKATSAKCVASTGLRTILGSQAVALTETFSSMTFSTRKNHKPVSKTMTLTRRVLILLA